jgi:hypothetical protein
MAGKTGGMTHNTPTQRRYDHRLKLLVQTTGDIAIATERGVPASTARGWLSSARYHEWNDSERCELDDRSSCPKTLPHQLTQDEVNTIRDMVTSPEFRHVPTSGLAQLAQRLGRVFASSATWHRLVRLHQWRRCRQRVHPAKPKVGIRATRANEIWHVDTTMIRLLDGIFKAKLSLQQS